MLGKSVQYVPKLTIETLDKSVKQVFLLLTLSIFDTFFSVSIVDSEQVNVSWETLMDNSTKKFVEIFEIIRTLPRSLQVSQIQYLTSV